MRFLDNYPHYYKVNRIFLCKAKITLFTLFLSSIAFAQSMAFGQQGINYKAIMKDDLGNVLSNTFMNVQFTIHSESESGIIVYQEDHNESTDSNGLLILSIGTDASPSIGVFENIDWSADIHFLQTTITYSGGTINFDAREFAAVPYALHAKTAESINISGNEIAFDNWDKDETDDFDGQYESLSGKPSTTISFHASSMGKSPTSTVITDSSTGLEWTNSFSSSSNIILKKPDNYNGEDVEFSIFFRTTSSSSGIVQFFIRPRSFNSGDGFTDSASVTSVGINVSGTSGFGTFYEQSITIPASRFTDDWWFISIQRNTESYLDDVIVMSASLTY
ncbi:hypothetical protein [Winogradskyella schleiferi]|uniref:hypothetical protein n=1 Tax=Winogradskyella schleiferi TaxID=2686078 RepID=UPI0015B9414E|nr:hypothetical protein [Winogradskyella schleiferi]